MKWLVFGLIGIMLLIIVACQESHHKDEQPVPVSDTQELIHRLGENELRVLEYDGCEYVIFKDHLAANQGFGFMAHKGNCKNPIHCHSQNSDE